MSKATSHSLAERIPLVQVLSWQSLVLLVCALAVKGLVLAHLRLFYLLCRGARRRQAHPCHSADALGLGLVRPCRCAEVVVALLGHAGRARRS